MMTTMVIDPHQLQHMDAQQLRALAEGLMAKLMDKDQEIHFKQTKIDLLTHEIARYKRLQFAAKSEHLQANQRSLLDETLDADLAALEAELQALSPAPAEPADASKAKPRRAPLPAHLPRVEISHEPENTQCGCGCQMKRIGEDVSEKLDYTPGTFTVERHVRGKWACVGCQKLIQAPVPAQIIDKGIPTSNLLADVLVAKYGDHLPLYRLEDIYARAGAPLPRSTLAQWVGQCGVQLRPLVDALKAEMMAHAVLHADETPVEMLKPGTGKTHKAYLWAYSPGVFEPMKAVVYDFADSRSGEHARAFLGDWKGSLICDDYGGYKASFANGITDVLLLIGLALMSLRACEGSPAGRVSPSPDAVPEFIGPATPGQDFAAPPETRAIELANGYRVHEGQVAEVLRREIGRTVLLQGEDNKQRLLKEFVENGRAVLVVLDTLEVLRARGETAVMTLIDHLDRLVEFGMGRVSVISAGRGDALDPVPDRLGGRLHLQGLESDAEDALLDMRGVPTKHWEAIKRLARGNPREAKKLPRFAASM